MTKNYELGDKAVFTITWLDQTGEEATLDGNSTITIKKYDPDTDSWSIIVNGSVMSSESGSTYFYEFDTSSETANYDYKVYYNASVDSIDVVDTEEFRITEAADYTNVVTSAELTSAKNEILSQVKELRHGNEKITFSYNGSLVDSMTILTKADSDSDWSSPTSTKTLYFNYTGTTLNSVGEDV